MFKAVLPNGKTFAFKAGLQNNPFDGHELQSAYKARLLGLKTVEHYAKLQAEGSNYYFMLMEHKPLRTIKFDEEDIFANLSGKFVLFESPKIKRLFEKQSKLLVKNGLLDPSPRNCFVETLPNGKPRLHWFDLRMAPKKLS